MSSKRNSASAFMLMQDIQNYNGEIVVNDSWTKAEGIEGRISEGDEDHESMDESEALSDPRQSPEANNRLTELNQQLGKTESNFGDMMNTISMLRSRYQGEKNSLEAQEIDKKERRKKRQQLRKSLEQNESNLQSSSRSTIDTESQQRHHNSDSQLLSYTDLNVQLGMELAIANYDAELLRRSTLEEDSSSYNPVSLVKVRKAEAGGASKTPASPEENISAILEGMTNTVKEISDYNYAVSQDYERGMSHMIKQEKKEKRRKLRHHHQANDADDAVSVSASTRSGRPEPTPDPTIEQIYTPGFQRIVADTNLKRKRLNVAKGRRAMPLGAMKSTCEGSVDSVSRGAVKRGQNRTRPANADRKAASVGPHSSQQSDVRAKASTMTNERPRKKRIGKFNVSKVSLVKTREMIAESLANEGVAWPSEQLVELYHNAAAQPDNFTSEETLRVVNLEESGSVKLKKKVFPTRKYGTRVEQVFEKTYGVSKTDYGSSLGVAEADQGNKGKDELSKVAKGQGKTYGAVKTEKGKERTYILKTDEQLQEAAEGMSKIDKVLDSAYGMTRTEKVRVAARESRMVPGREEGVTDKEQKRAQAAKNIVPRNAQKATKKEVPPPEQPAERSSPDAEQTEDKQEEGRDGADEHVQERDERNTDMRYAQPTLSSRMKKVQKSCCFDRFNFVQVPFVCGTSITPSHNLGINLQSIFCLMKMKQPGISLSPTEVAGGLLRESRFTGTNNRPLTRLLTRMTTRLAPASLIQCPAMRRISEIELSTCDETASIAQQDRVSSVNRFASGVMRAEDAWTRDKDCSDPQHVNKRCTCFPIRKTANSKKVVRKHFEDMSASQKKPVLDEQEQGDMFESLQTRIKGLKKVLLALQEDFQELNKQYNETCTKNNGERSKGSKERIGLLEKQLSGKEEEINVVMGLFKEVMSLKGQIKQMGHGQTGHGQTGHRPPGQSQMSRLNVQPSGLTDSPLFCRSDVHNPYENTAAVRYTRLLRCMQSFQGQLRH